MRQQKKECKKKTITRTHLVTEAGDAPTGVCREAVDGSSVRQRF